MTETLVICLLSASTATPPMAHIVASTSFASQKTTVCCFPPSLCFFFAYPISSRPYSITTPVLMSMMDQEPLQPEKKKRGRPKGSKDKPQQPGDKPRGRPRKAPNPTQAARVEDTADVDGKSRFSVPISPSDIFYF